MARRLRNNLDRNVWGARIDDLARKLRRLELSLGSAAPNYLTELASEADHLAEEMTEHYFNWAESAHGE